MKITSLIAQHLLDVHEGNNWTEVSLADVLKDTTLEEATTLTSASPNTIASLLHHITYWNRAMVQRIAGNNVMIDEYNGFDLPELITEDDWLQLQVDNNLSSHELAVAILNFDNAKLEEPLVNGGSSAYKNMQGAVEHVHYHLGQMMILKKLVKAKREAE
ncbi:MAG: DinB family protein [Bacteroidota bacterium]|nr:DinB family protein [Bacteroidota bacterium]